jgi:diguanylate cyclase (GGDEF)-like protein
MIDHISFKTIRVTSFGFLIFINLFVGIFFYFQMGELIHEISAPIKKERPFLSDILKIQNLTSTLDLRLHDQIAGDIIDNTSSLQIIEMIFSELESLRKQNIIQDEEKIYIDTFTKNLKQLRVALIYYRNNKLYDSSSSSSDELFEIIDDSLTGINQNLTNIISTLRRQINESDLKVLKDVKFAQKTLIFIFSLVVIGSLLVFFLFNMSLSANLRKLIQGTNMLGAGDLEWRIKSKFNDEFGKLSHAFDEMAQKISTSNKQISHQTYKIEKLAYYDPLTELPNRVTFIARLKEEIERASRGNEKLAVLFIDLDDFKIVNDIYGHDIGDILLKQVAERMTQHTRLSDTVARLGGDEFTILLTQQNSSEDSSFVGKRILQDLNRPFDISNRIVKELNRPFRIKEKEINISSSIGIAIYPDNGESAADILRNADTAMYAAKAEGKNNFRFCSEEMANKMQELFQTEKDMRSALVNDEFVLYYQPQIDLKTEKICGLEALIRWIHPEKGFIPPVDFIPLAEERGIINDITKWVLRTVCKQQNLWEKSGCSPVPVMVNLSARDFYQQDIEKFITDLINKEDIAPSLLGIEVTETSVMEDKTNAVKTLANIKKLGIKIALDDFGTGYSSLNYLQILPIDVVKIDRSFIHEITSSPKNAAITEAIIAMSHTLGLKVLVEGVETNEQSEFIKEIQCDYVQGYLFSKPLPEKEITPLLKQDLRKF